MLRTDEDALVCDLAETYQILDYRQLPVTMVAVFSSGLRPNARIFKSITGNKIDLSEMLLANMADRLGMLVWAKTKDAETGKNKPASILNMLIGKQEEKENMTFLTGEDFEKARQKIIGGGD